MVILQIPMIMFLSCCAMGLPAYVGANLDGRQFHKVNSDEILLCKFCKTSSRLVLQLMGIYSATLWTFEASAQVNDTHHTCFGELLCGASSKYVTACAIGDSQLMGVLCTNALLGMLGYIFYWIFSYLYAGLFLPEQAIPWPLKASPE